MDAVVHGRVRMKVKVIGRSLPVKPKKEEKIKRDKNTNKYNARVLQIDFPKVSWDLDEEKMRFNGECQWQRMT